MNNNNIINTFISIYTMMTCFKLVWMWGLPLYKPWVQGYHSVNAFYNFCMHCKSVIEVQRNEINIYVFPWSALVYHDAFYMTMSLNVWVKKQKEKKNSINAFSLNLLVVRFCV